MFIKAHPLLTVAVALLACPADAFMAPATLSLRTSSRVPVSAVTRVQTGHDLTLCCVRGIAATPRCVCHARAHPQRLHYWQDNYRKKSRNSQAPQRCGVRARGEL